MVVEGGASQEAKEIIKCVINENKHNAKVEFTLGFTQNIRDLIKGFLSEALGVEMKEDEEQKLREVKVTVETSGGKKSRETHPYFELLDKIVKGKLQVDLVKLLDALKKAAQSAKSLKRTRFLLDTCYDKRRANELIKVIDVLGRVLQKNADKDKCNAMCKGAAALLAYYVVMLESERKSAKCERPEVWLAFGDLFRSYVMLLDKEGYRRISVIRLCPWEGDVAALLYATLLYCRDYQRVKVDLELPGEPTRLASIQVNCNSVSSGGPGGH